MNYQRQINDQYQIRSMNKEDFDPLFQKYTKLFFANKTQVFRLREPLTEEDRSKGLYAELVNCALEVTTEMGFQSIWSRHNATNNAVIIPKLKNHRADGEKVL